MEYYMEFMAQILNPFEDRSVSTCARDARGGSIFPTEHARPMRMSRFTATVAVLIGLSFSAFALGAETLRVAVDVNNAAEGRASLDGWEMRHVDRGLWRHARAVEVDAPGRSIEIEGAMNPPTSNYARAYIDKYGRDTEIGRFVCDGFFNQSAPGVTPTTISGLVPGEPVTMWLYAWGGGNDGGVTRFRFDLDNDGEWDEDLVHTGEPHVDVSSTRTVVPNVIAPDLLEGGAEGLPWRAAA
jgi:hypothetical protein